MGLGQEMQKDNLAQQLNKNTLNLSKGLFSLPADVPQLGGGYECDGKQCHYDQRGNRCGEDSGADYCE